MRPVGPRAGVPRGPTGRAPERSLQRADLHDRTSGPCPDHPEGLVQVRDLDLGVPADDLLALDIRTVGDYLLSSAVETYGARGLRGQQLVAATDPVLVDRHPLRHPFVRAVAVGRSHLRQLPGELLGVDEQQYVSHLSLLPVQLG